jgi:hypothetical protein
MTPSLSGWMPRLRTAALAAAVAVLLFGIVGYFAIPKVARWGVESVASRELGRTVTVQEITANPFSLQVTLRGLEVAGAPGETTPLLTIREVVANASIESVVRLAPVLDALSIDALTANIVRLDAQRFSFSDIVDRVRARPKTSDEPARFSVSNIEVTNSTAVGPVATKWLTVALTGTTDTVTDGGSATGTSMSGPWNFYRANINSISTSTAGSAGFPVVTVIVNAA